MIKRKYIRRKQKYEYPLDIDNVMENELTIIINACHCEFPYEIKCGWCKKNIK